MRVGFPYYADIETYLASPPAAGLGWMWTAPDWWRGPDHRKAAKLGMTVLEYVTTISKLLGHSGVAVTARYLDHLTNHQAISALDSISLFPASSSLSSG
jgi:hypothetical protein